MSEQAEVANLDLRFQESHAKEVDAQPTPSQAADTEHPCRRIESTEELLRLWSTGSSEAGGAFLARIYPELCRLAASLRFSSEVSARPSDLVQEMYLRLYRQDKLQFANKQHFFAIAARLIRRVVVDHVRRKQRLKRSHPGATVDIHGNQEPAIPARPDILEINQALEQLAELSPSTVQVVELRYFAGLTVDETASVLGIGRTTVVRRWRFARAWLRMRLERSAKA